MRNLRSVIMRAAISFVLATTLWTFVNFSENPDQQGRFEDLSIMVENIPPGLVMVDEKGMPLAELPYTVNATVVAPLEVFSEITRSSIQPYIDLSGYESGTHNVKVQVRPNQPQLRITSLEPEQVPVRLEREASATVPLDVRLAGDPPYSYEAREPEVIYSGQPIAAVQVRGPASQMQRVDKALIVIDINGQTNTIQAERQPIPVDAGENQVGGVSVVPPAVDVRVRIASSAGVKRVPVVARWRGSPADGFALVRVSTQPAFVEIFGQASILDTIGSLDTIPVDLSNASESFTATTELNVPDNVTLGDQSNVPVQVGVFIEPVELAFSLSLQVPVEWRNLQQGLNVLVDPQLLPVSLTGTTQALSALRSSELEALVDLEGLGPGTYTLTAELDVPAGIQLDQALPPVSVTISPVATVTPAPPTPDVPPTGAVPPTPDAALTPTPSVPVTPTEAITPTP